MMDALVTEIESCQQALQDALATLDASAITTATEALAAAMAQLRNHEANDIAHDKTIIGRLETLQQGLNQSAIRTNILKNWTRQRIDRTNDLRGINSGGKKLSY
jgi:pSer/pThr/pTyr-binding forkhead associated (FHA) protein